MIWFPNTCTYHGSFRVVELNEMVVNFGIQFVPVSSSMAGGDGMYLYHAENHFPGLWCREGHFRLFDGRKQSIIGMGGLSSLCQSIITIFFRLYKHKEKSLSTLCNLRGGSGGMLHRPAAQGQSHEFSCPLNTCSCAGCNGTVIDKGRAVDAVCYTMSDPVEVLHKPKQCTSRSCRATYGYNFRWESNQKKMNILGIEDLQDDILLVSSTKAFSLQYLRFHEELFLRGHISIRAIEHAYKTVFGIHNTEDECNVVVRIHKLHQIIIFYHLALQEFQNIGVHNNRMIDDEIANDTLDVYNTFCHSRIFPPKQRDSVKYLVSDGHLALKPRCEAGPLKRAGRPRIQQTTSSKHSNGWFMCCDPGSGRILSLMVMHEPECNRYVIESLESILWLYPKYKNFVDDRA